MLGDVSTILLTFNEVLEKGFDGHNFISGLNSHLRDLLVSKDESTVRLLEATHVVRQRYLQQSGTCPVDFLFKALEIGTNCDLSFKSSKNPRLHVELSLIRLCRLMGEGEEDSEKKKSDPERLKSHDEEMPLPSKSEILRQESKPVEKKLVKQEILSGKHDPVIEKPSKTFSIKEVISAEIKPVVKPVEIPDMPAGEVQSKPKEEFNPESFEVAWNEFKVGISGEGTRIVSMFKAIKPEVENDQTIKIHLSNAAQKDTFIQNYKQRLMNFLEKKFSMTGIDVETAVDLSEESEILYSDEQKYNYLFNKYPILKEVKKTFNLDIT